MSTKVEQASSNSQITTAATSTVPATPGSKVSRFAANSGFVIPKNKLSGSLVPIVRGSKKGTSYAAAEEGSKQVQRKTKWGADLTQDSAVRKGRALAYQTRLEQITQQLNLGTLGTRDVDGVESAHQVKDERSSNYKLEKQALKNLELERREAIGEILKLDPSYKAPADYKTLQKEAKVLIPIKEHPSNDFIGLMLGPVNDTLKRLEKETGAKIRVFGTKAGTREKAEVTTYEGPDMHKSFEELHVHISSETYEKVDAAVALIELLVTPVSANPASVLSTTVAGDSVNATAPAEGTRTDVISQGMLQMAVESTPAAQQMAFQHDPGRWYPINATQTPMLPTAGFTSQANPSAPLISNPPHSSPLPFNTISTPSVFGPQQAMPSGLSSAPAQNPPFFSSGPQPPQSLLRPYLSQPPPMNHTGIPRNPFPLFTQSIPVQPNATVPSQLFSNQSIPMGPHPSGGASSGWSQSMVNTSPTLSPGNMIARPPAMVTPHSHLPMVSQPIALSVTPPQNLPPSQPSAPQLAVTPVSRTISVPPVGSSTHFQMGLSVSPFPSLGSAPASLPIHSSNFATQPALPQMPLPASAPTGLAGSTAVPSPLQSGVPSSASGNVSNYNASKPPFLPAPRPLQPSSSDFTFQTNRPQIPAPQVPQRINSHPLPAHPNQPVQLLQGSPNPSFSPALHNTNPSPIIEGFPRPQIVNHMSQHRPQAHVALGGGPVAQPGPVRHAIYPNPPAVSPNAVRHMLPRNPRPIQIQAPDAPPQRFLAPNHQLRLPLIGRAPFLSPGGQQVYDPFSPTSVPPNLQLSSNRTKMEKPESDPEYEDLMASVGVK